MEKERESVEEGGRSVSGSFNSDFKLRFCEINARGLSHFPNTVRVCFDLNEGRKSKRDCEIIVNIFNIFHNFIRKLC